MTAGALAIAYHLVSRLGYVCGVGTLLTLEKRHRRLAARYGPDAGYRRFRRIAAALMNNDAVSFAVLCLVTRGTLAAPFSPAIRIGAGLIAIVLGAAVKLWARRALGSTGYHWHDFFEANPTAPHRPPGPYRYLKNPMYTLGYLHAYGFALVFASFPALILAAFDQAAVLVFYRLVEKPHFEQLSRQ